MVDQVITKQELIDAQKDAQTLEDAVNGEPGKLIKSRLGREFYSLSSVPQINTMTREEVTAALAPKANDADVYKKTETFTKTETNALVAPKANQADVDTALSNLSTTANKYYSTLAAANADIANIALNQSVTIGEEANSGLWEKKTAGATGLTKSPYDPLTQAKEYTDAKATVKAQSIPAAANLNGYTTEGNYYTSTANAQTGINFPVVESGILRVDVTNWFATVQTYTSLVNGIIYQRHIRADQTWTAWKKIIDENTLATFVASQFSSKPTITGQLLSDMNLDNYKTEGQFFSGSDISTLENNYPEQGKGGILEVGSTHWGAISQRFTTLADGKIYIRTLRLSSATWSNWSKVSQSEDLAQLLNEAKSHADSLKEILDGDIAKNRDSISGLIVSLHQFAHAFNSETYDLNTMIAAVKSDIAAIFSSNSEIKDELKNHLVAIQILVKAIESQSDEIQKTKDSAKDQIVATHLLVQQLNEEKDASSGSGIGLARGVFKYGETYLKDQVFTHASGTYIALEDVVNAQTTPDQDNRYGCISESDGAAKVAELSVKSTSITTGHPSSEVPHTISPDGMKMWATYNMGKLLESSDFGQTWNQIHDFGDIHRVVWVRQTDNGELLLRTETYVYGGGGLLTDVRQRVRRSVGYGTETMTFETCIDIQNRRNVLFHNGWGISTHKNIILIAEYGAKGDEPWGGQTLPAELSARYAYMSLDYGVTWKTIFDAKDHIADTNGVHLHGICYDPYWERIWINCGDRVSGLWYSDDLGATWTESEYFERDSGGIAPPDKRQNVGIIALPTCVLFGTDYAQDGIHRIDRAHGKHIVGGKYPVDVAHAIEFGQGHTRAQVCHIINHTYQKTNAPIIFGFCSETPVAGTAPAGTVVVTYDGWNFKQIWQDELWQPSGKGLQSLAGITLLNEIIIKSADSRSPTANTYTKITLKV